MNSKLYQIKNWLELAHAANYNSRELAKTCGVSVRQLQRFVLCETGKSPQRWLNDLRLRKASSLIENGQTVKEAAHELKYKQRSHFSREFKRYHGVPPSYTQSAPGRQMSLQDT